jgi:hypothetical protein
MIFFNFLWQKASCLQAVKSLIFDHGAFHLAIAKFADSFH